MVLAGAEHRDDVAGAIGGGEGREGRADEEKEGGKESAWVGGGALASGHGGRRSWEQSRRAEWRWVGVRSGGHFLGFESRGPVSLGLQIFSPINYRQRYIIQRENTLIYNI